MGDKQWTDADFKQRFKTNDYCLDYLVQIKFRLVTHQCSCGCTLVWKTKRRLWVCRNCERQFSPLQGTIFQGTKLPLKKWFEIIWWFLKKDYKEVCSARGLQGNLPYGISNRTAIKCLSEIRRILPMIRNLPLKGPTDRAAVVYSSGGCTGQIEAIVALGKVTPKKIKLTYLMLTENKIDSASNSHPSQASGIAKSATSQLRHNFRDRVSPDNIQLILNEIEFRFNRRFLPSRDYDFSSVIAAAFR